MIHGEAGTKIVAVITVPITKTVEKIVIIIIIIAVVITQEGIYVMIFLDKTIWRTDGGNIA